MFNTIRQNLQKNFIKFTKYVSFGNNATYTNFKNGTVLLSYISLFKNILPDSEPSQIKVVIHKSEHYWLKRTLNELIDEADVLYREGKFMEVYELLNRMQYINNVEVQWRICRALFKLSLIENLSTVIKNNMLIEAFDLIKKTLELDDNHSEVHKWMAIILDAKMSLDGTMARIKAAPEVKKHMLKCIELDPNEVSVLYMLGYWCYEMTNLTWIQNNIVKVIFSDPPKSSYQEAYEYFMRVEELYPRSFIGNAYMLGKCCYNMGMHYRARYYLKIASELPARTPYQKVQLEEAKILAEKLKEYDVTVEALATNIKRSNEIT